MRKLGLTNFRKFKELKPLELGGVTFLVGENNSGKSTFTKAAILLSNFLSKDGKSLDAILDVNDPSGKKFSFRDNNFRHVYIDTFYQALCNRSDNGVITFEATIDDFDIKVNVVEPDAFQKERGLALNALSIEEFSSCYPEIRIDDPEYYKKELSKETALVSSILVEDLVRGIGFLFDYETFHISVNIYDLDKKHTFEENVNLFNSGKFEDGAEDTIIESIEALRKEIIKEKLSSQFYVSNSALGLLGPFLQKYSDNPEAEIIKKSFEHFNAVIKETKIEYIYAHSVHQLSSYSYGISGSNDYVDQTISRFYNQELKYKRGLLSCPRRPKDLVVEWMSSLGIGDDFKIIGETSLKQLDSEKKLYASIIDGDEEYDLSTKGIGMIQLFILLLRLATIVTDSNRIKTVVLEEPEQNLHPALQSKLAQVFYDVYNEFDCRIIIETHSEYMIRKSSVIVSNIDNPHLDNPFKVYYFPSDGLPYEMHYLHSGAFQEQFGNGFYDEAVRLHLQIMNKD